MMTCAAAGVASSAGKAVVLSIDVDRERISLGIKKMAGDPFSNFVAVNDKGSLVKGSVRTVDPKGAVVMLEGGVEAYLRASEVSRDRVEDIRTHLREGDEIEAVVLNVDRKNRSINLSIKAKDMVEDGAAVQRIQEAAPANAGTTNLGALLKAKLGSSSDK